MKTTRKAVRKPIVKTQRIKRPAGKTREPAATTSKSRPQHRPVPMQASMHGEVVPLYVISDSTGNLALHMLTAFLTQFPKHAFGMHRHNFVQTKPKLAKVFEHITSPRAIVFHAVVQPEMKKAITDECRKRGIPECDLTGQFVEFLSRESGIAPARDVNRLHDMTSEYRQRIKALEFTLEHDDGLGLDTIYEADIVLAGVSRTSKTPTSIYLAQQGYRVANVSLAMGVDPPQQLLNLEKRSVVGLVIDPGTLVEIRTNRNVGWRMGNTRYNDPDFVDREIAWSKRLFLSKGWPVLNVTDQAVEETAAKIVDALGLAHGKTGVHPLT
jgi:regulator of PEP synthase PpsR (kinase-PPPase family)